MIKPHYYIDKIADYEGKEVILKGWLYNIRTSGKLMFPWLRDGTGFIQCVVSQKEVPEKVWEDFNKLTQESSIIVTGTVNKHPKKEEYELHAKDLQIVQIAEQYPITPKEHGVEFLAVAAEDLAPRQPGQDRRVLAAFGVRFGRSLSEGEGGGEDYDQREGREAEGHKGS